MSVSIAPTVRRPHARPATDILEQADGLLVMVNMPGVPAENVLVEVERHELIIRARSSCGCDTRHTHGIHTLEFVDVDYGVRLALPDGMENGDIRAWLRNGVLSVLLPRVDSDMPRRIPVESA